MTPTSSAARPRLIDGSADYRETLATGRHGEDGAREIKAQLPDKPPSDGRVLRRSSATPHRRDPPARAWHASGSIPAFFGYFPQRAALLQRTGDFPSTSLGVLGLSWHSKPALT